LLGDTEISVKKPYFSDTAFSLLFYDFYATVSPLFVKCIKFMATISATQFIPEALANRREMDIRTGDTVRVHVKIEEKGKTRIQLFEGLVIATKHGAEPGASFTVRKVSHGVGVERIFPLYSPMIDKIEIIRRTRVRRSKLYFIREKVTRDIRRKLRNFAQFFSSSSDLTPVEPAVMESEIMDEPVIETPAIEPADSQTVSDSE
jgi:large subunit ribosomal protein L19